MLAARAGTTQPSIARIEAGRVTPGIPTLERIAEALGLELVVRLNTEQLDALRAEVARAGETLLQALDRIAPEVVGRQNRTPVVDGIEAHLGALLTLHYDGHPWARLLVAFIAHRFRPQRSVAESLIGESFRDFRRARDRRGMGYVAWVRGQAALGRGDLRKAQQSWETARGYLPGDSPADRIDELSLANSALGAYATGDLDECSEIAQRAVVLARLRRNHAAEGLGLVYLAFVALNRGDFERAERFCAEGHEAFDRAAPEDRVPRSVVHTCLGTLHSLRGGLELAKGEFAAATLGADEWFVVIARAVRAEMLAGADPAMADEDSRFVLGWARETKDAWWRTWAERGLGIGARARGELDASRQILEGIEDLNPLERGRTLLALGETCADLDDLGAAESALNEAGEIFRSRGARYWEVRALLQLARARPLQRPRLIAAAQSKSSEDAAYHRLFVSASGQLAIRLEEPRGILVDGVAVQFRSRPARELLYRLAGEGQVPAPQLAAILWPGSPPKHQLARLRTALWDARRSLGSQAWRVLRNQGDVVFDLSGAELIGSATAREPVAGRPDQGGAKGSVNTADALDDDGTGDRQCGAEPEQEVVAGG